MRMLKTFVITALMSVMFSVSVFAASRDYTVNITKDYVAAKITIEVPDDRTYYVTVEEPHSDDQPGRIYDATFVDDRVLECIINDQLKQGEWTVHVKTAIKSDLSKPSDPKEDEKDDKKNDEEGSEEESIEEPAQEDEGDEPIDGVKIKFEGSAKKILDVEDGGDITVASDITGVQMYFRDNTFVVEWTDTTVGDVNIEVINEATHESLGKKQVSGKSYELELDPQKVKGIVVTITPANSENIEGASKTYTIEFKNEPAAILTYEPIEITNRDTIKLHLSSKGNYALWVYDNEKEVLKTDLLGEGEFDFDIPTVVGDNNYIAYVVDDRHYMKSTAGYVEKDVIAPALKLSSEYVNVVTLDPQFTFEGKVEDFETFTINDADVYIEGDHTFKYEYPLKEGVNYVTFKAVDKAGNVSEYTADIERVIPKEEPIPWDKIIIISIIAVFVIVYIIMTVRKAKYGAESVRLANLLNFLKKTDNDVKEERVREPMPFNTKVFVCDMLELIVPALVILVIMTKVIGVSTIQSGSMEPTLKVGSTVFYNKLCYSLAGQEIRRGDIICFYDPTEDKYLSKRVIGIPGDKIEFLDGYVVLNGQICDESAYIGKDVETNSDKRFEVPEHSYFVLGDNRENSYDSRFWTNPYVDASQIEGRFMGQLDFSLQYDVFNKLYH